MLTMIIFYSLIVTIGILYTIGHNEYLKDKDA